MKNYILIILLAVILIPANSYAQSTKGNAADENAIKMLVQDIADSWAKGNGENFAGHFTDDIDFTVWNGMYFNGHEENAKNHQMIFDTFYKGTMVKFEIRKIRFLSDEIATVHLKGKMYRDGKRVEGVPVVVPLMVLKKVNGNWRVAVFQNTPVIEQGELVVGRKAETARNEN